MSTLDLKLHRLRVLLSCARAMYGAPIGMHLIGKAGVDDKPIEGCCAFGHGCRRTAKAITQIHTLELLLARAPDRFQVEAVMAGELTRAVTRRGTDSHHGP